MLKMLRMLCEKAGIEIGGQTRANALVQPTSLHEMARQIDEAEERKKKNSGPAA
jgi:hypothetical protein